VSSLDAEVLVLRKEVNILRTSKAGTISNQKRRAKESAAEPEDIPEDQVSALEKPSLFTKNEMRDMLVLKAGAHRGG